MEGNGSATARLREEHQVILVVLDAFERMLDAADPTDPPRKDLDDCLGFFRSFTEACHHGKEEDLLFRELEEHGVSQEEGPLAVMIQEHRMGSRLVNGMSEALHALSAGDDGAWSRFEEAGRDYLELLRNHIGKEDGGVFEMADGMVTGSACARLCARYEKVCSRRFEGRKKEELEALAQDLARRADGLSSRPSDTKGGGS